MDIVGLLILLQFHEVLMLASQHGNDKCLCFMFLCKEDPYRSGSPT